MIRLSLTALTFAVAMGMSAPSQADHDGDIVEVVFEELERQIIERYFRDEDGGLRDDLPPGLAKRDDLPPGLAKQIERNGHLPPGLEKRSLPDDLEHDLPAAKPGTERTIVGVDVILIETATGVILDVIEDVLIDD